MNKNERTTIPEDFDFDKLVVLYADDLLRNGCDPDKIDYLFDMGSETIEYDQDTDNVWYAGFPTGMTLAEYIQDINEHDIDV